MECDWKNTKIGAIYILFASNAGFFD